MKNLLLRVHVVVETLNLEISRRLADYVKKFYKGACRTRAAQLFFLVQPIRSLFSGVVSAVAFVFCLNSLRSE